MCVTNVSISISKKYIREHIEIMSSVFVTPFQCLIIMVYLILSATLSPHDLAWLHNINASYMHVIVYIVINWTIILYHVNWAYTYQLVPILFSVLENDLSKMTLGEKKWKKKNCFFLFFIDLGNEVLRSTAVRRNGVAVCGENGEHCGDINFN